MPDRQEAWRQDRSRGTDISRPAAKAWIRQREAELDNPHSFKAATQTTHTLDDAISRYIAEYGGEVGKTKAQCLTTIRRHSIASMACADIGSADIVALARALGVGAGASTVGNYLAHLSAVFVVAKRAWSYPLDPEAMADALFVLRKQRLVTKSNKRDRRPTLDELDRLLGHFDEVKVRAPRSAPMVDIIIFALFSTRRQEEITRIEWEGFEPSTGKHPARVLVRDMKNPGVKRGNDIWCELPPEAEAVIKRQPRNGDCIFPHGTDGISAAFTRACKLLGIDDLHFHDLRHEGVSRLFEAGWGIPHVALVGGHRSWGSLQRYAHIRQCDDKYLGWRWRP